MIVCFAGARRLGLDCLTWLSQQDNVHVKAAWVPNGGWWTDCDDRAELDALNIPLIDPVGFRGLKPDLVVSVLTDYIFTARDLVRYPAVNLHPAPLPRYRGCNSYAHAIQNGEQVYGVTLHYVDEGIDTGPIIHTAEVPLLSRDTGRSLYDRAQGVALALFKVAMPRVLEAHRQGRWAEWYPQEGEAGYYPRSSLRDKRAHPTDDARIRALTFPPHPAPEITTAVPPGFGR